MLSYVTDTLTILQHNNPWNPQHQPYPHIWPNYGAKAQYAKAADLSPSLSIADNVFYKQSLGFFLYYVRAVDPTMLTALVWEYTVFGTPIGLLNLRAGDFPNIALYDECHKLTRKPRRFPLGTLGTETITDTITRTVHKEMFLYTPWRSLKSRLI